VAPPLPGSPPPAPLTSPTLPSREFSPSNHSPFLHRPDGPVPPLGDHLTSRDQPAPTPLTTCSADSNRMSDHQDWAASPLASRCIQPPASYETPPIGEDLGSVVYAKPQSRTSRFAGRCLTALRINCGVITRQLLDADRVTNPTMPTNQGPSLATESRRLLHALVRRCATVNYMECAPPTHSPLVPPLRIHRW